MAAIGFRAFLVMAVEVAREKKMAENGDHVKMAAIGHRPSATALFSSIPYYCVCHHISRVHLIEHDLTH